MATLKAAWQAFQELNGIGQGLGNFAAGPPSTNALGRAVQGTVAAQCRGYSRSPAWIRALDPSTYLVYDSMCRPLADSSGYDLPTVGNTHSGGRCEGVQYNISYEIRTRTSERFVCGEFGPWNPATGVIGTNSPLVGPISNIETRFTVASTNPGASAPDRVQFIITDATGNKFLNIAGSASRLFFRGCGVSAEYRNVVLTRVDGLPDECGDPPLEPIPGPNPAPPGDVPPDYRPRPGPTNDPFGTIPLLPTDDPELGPITPGLTVNVGGGGGGGPSGARPGSPDGVGSPQAGGEGTGGGGEGEDFEFGEPPPGRVWVGALVEVEAPTSLGNIAGSGPGNRVFPRVIGNCSLTFSGGRGRAQRIESQWTDLTRGSDALQVTGARVNVLPSVSFRVYPVSDETCPENTCSSEAE